MTATTSFRNRPFDFEQLTAPDSTFTDFQNTFQDFFSKISEVDDNEDTVVAMLEDKLIPRSTSNNNKGEMDQVRNWNRRQSRRGSARRSFHRRSSEYHSRGRTEAAATSVPVSSPIPGRRRSSSIGVARQPPDVQRYLSGEPWSRGNPGPSSPLPGPSLRPVSPRTMPHTPTHTPVHFESNYRSRTSSMPVVPRHRPMLGQLKRTEEPDDVEYYRVRSFSITPNGIYNLGDSFRSRRSRSITSVSSNGSSQSVTSIPSHRDRVPSGASQISEKELAEPTPIPKFKVAVLGAPGVGKTALTCQFTTSEYICAYDTSLDEEFGQKIVSVMLDGQEAELEIVDHPASEMSVESFCSTYSPDVFVVVYSIIDRKSLKTAEEILLFLWKEDYIASKGVILVGNKVDLERKREVPASVGRKVANNCGCKFIETSSGLDHNVDELLVGILAQVKLNPRRNRDKIHKKKKKQKVQFSSGKKLLKHLLGLKDKSKSCENLFVL